MNSDPAERSVMAVSLITCPLSRTERVQVHVYMGNNESEGEVRLSRNAVAVGPRKSGKLDRM